MATPTSSIQAPSAQPRLPRTQLKSSGPIPKNRIEMHPSPSHSLTASTDSVALPKAQTPYLWKNPPLTLRRKVEALPPKPATPIPESERWKTLLSFAQLLATSGFVSFDLARILPKIFQLETEPVEEIPSDDPDSGLWSEDLVGYFQGAQEDWKIAQEEAAQAAVWGDLSASLEAGYLVPVNPEEPEMTALQLTQEGEARIQAAKEQYALDHPEPKKISDLLRDPNLPQELYAEIRQVQENFEHSIQEEKERVYLETSLTFNAALDIISLFCNNPSIGMANFILNLMTKHQLGTSMLSF